MDTCTCPEHGRWYSAADIDPLVRRIDVALHGEDGAARQALLIDVVPHITHAANMHGPLLAALSAQPSPGGQGDSRSEKAATFLRQYLTYLRSSPRQGLRPRWCDVYEALEIAIEALSAKPSPGGQGDPVGTIRDRDGVFEIELSESAHDTDAGALDGRAVYLAARQPVGEDDQEYLESLDRALEGVIDQRDRYHEIADDLAGHIAAITGVDIGEHSSANCPWQNAIEAAEVYQPAQAVDLGQFRQPVQDWLDDAQASMEEHGDYDGVFGHAIKEGTRLLALIDSQAVKP